MWYSNLEVSEQFQLQNVGTSSWKQFVEQREVMVPDLKVARYEPSGDQNAGQRVLDFGCSIGCIVLKKALGES